MYKASNIPDAGYGVFVMRDKQIEKDTVLTEYSGVKLSADRLSVLQKYSDSSYQNKDVQVGRYLSYDYIRGIEEPEIGQGMGSFINRPPKGGKANVKFHYALDKLWIQAISVIKQGSELYICYNSGSL
jgi:hypothetical protein